MPTSCRFSRLKGVSKAELESTLLTACSSYRWHTTSVCEIVKPRERLLRTSKFILGLLFLWGMLTSLTFKTTGCVIIIHTSICKGGGDYRINLDEEASKRLNILYAVQWKVTKKERPLVFYGYDLSSLAFVHFSPRNCLLKKEKHKALVVLRWLLFSIPP